MSDDYTDEYICSKQKKLDEAFRGKYLIVETEKYNSLQSALAEANAKCKAFEDQIILDLGPRLEEANAKLESIHAELERRKEQLETAKEEILRLTSHKQKNWRLNHEEK